MALVPLAVARSAWSSPGGAGDWTRTVVLAPFDLVLIAACGWAARHRGLLVGLFGSRLARVGGATFAAGFAVAFVAHPSWLGVALGARLGAGLVVVAVAGTALADRSGRTILLAGATTVGVAQALLGAVQSARGEAFGVAPLDWDGLLYPFGSSLAGRGGMTHPYHLAVLLVVAQGAALLGLRAAARRGPWLVALALLGMGLAITYTRAGLLGQVALLAVAVVARRSGPTRWAAAAITLGLLVGAVAFGDGWVAKGEATQGGDVTTSRTRRLEEAIDLAAGDPLTGVGPGRYVAALATNADLPELLPAHNLLAHEAAELGPIGLIGAVLLLVALARLAVRGGAWGLMIALPMAPFLAFDAFPYVFPAGLALVAIWLALLRDTGAETEP